MKQPELYQNYTFLVYLNQSKETQLFWNKNKAILSNAFPHSKVYYADSTQTYYPIEAKTVVIIIGEDSSFHYTINQYKDLWKQVIFAFIPVTTSRLISRFSLPTQLNDHITLIKKQNHLFINILQCNHIDTKGFNRQTFVYNDVYFNRLHQTDRTIQNKPILSTFSKEEQIYQGEYCWGGAFLGDSLIANLALTHTNYFHYNQFLYIQVNKKSFCDYLKLHTILKKQKTIQNQNLLCLTSNFMSLYETRANTLIYADDILIGTFPLTLRLMKQACRLITPFAAETKKTRVYRSKSVPVSAISK